jgi:hypothetical protein
LNINEIFDFFSLAKTGSSIIDLPCSIIYAGLEPIDFINLFPKWTVNMKARQQNQLVSIIFGYMYEVCLCFRKANN